MPRCGHESKRFKFTAEGCSGYREKVDSSSESRKTLREREMLRHTAAGRVGNLLSFWHLPLLNLRDLDIYLITGRYFLLASVVNFMVCPVSSQGSVKHENNIF